MRRVMARVVTGAVLIAIPVAGWIGACARTDRHDRPAPEKTPYWDITPDSFGSVPLGVPLEQASSALGDSLLPGVNFDLCTMSRTASMPSGTMLMVLRDRIGGLMHVERVDVDSTGVHTREGAGVGDSEAQVLAQYRPLARVEPHKYTGPEGHYIVVTSPTDSNFRIVFETDGQRVLRFRAGRRPAVDFVERCS